MHQLKSLAHVVREGTISGAPRSLGVSQSAVSQHIIKLEAKVGMPLLVRGREGLHLTQVGQEIFELADELAVLDQQIEERLRSHVDLAYGHLTVIANAPQPALSLIAEYTHLFPRISVDFALLDWSSAMERVSAKQVDIAIITDPSFQKDLDIRPIKTARYVLYVRKDTTEFTSDETCLEEISKHTLLLPEQGSLTRRTVHKALENAGLKPRRVVTMTIFPVMKEAILQRIGVGIFLDASSADESQLREVKIKDLRQEFTASIVVPKYKVGLRIVQSFLNLIERGTKPL